MITPETAGPHDFDFFFGDWEVRHHKLNHRLKGSDDWSDFTGRTTTRPLGLGVGNIDENQLDDPSGPYAALTVRFFDPATRLWTIYWVDSRRPQMEPAVSGSFKDGVGTFHADDVFEGKPIRVRFLWSHADPDAPQWEQAFSPDGGASWETNWVMEFTRRAG